MTELLERKPPVVDDLCRQVAFEVREDGAEADGDGLDGNTLVGYGAVFGSTTRINSWEGLFDEQIKRGAFKRSLSERTPVLQFDHGRHPMVGSIPLGYFEALREDASGLYIEAPLHDNWLVQPVRDAIKSKAIPGMSFRFSVVKDEWHTAAGELLTDMDEIARLIWAATEDAPSTILTRTLLEVKLFEVGPVVFPAYLDTCVDMRSRELASLLTDPQVRAELARALVGTPSEPGEGEGPSGEGRAASTVEEPPTGTPDKHVPSPAARARALMLEGVI